VRAETYYKAGMKMWRLMESGIVARLQCGLLPVETENMTDVGAGVEAYVELWLILEAGIKRDSSVRWFFGLNCPLGSRGKGLRSIFYLNQK
jgi:hypothetical protein